VYLALIKNEIPHQIEKKKKRYDGFSFGSPFFMIGKRSITKAAPAQFIPVENGTMLGWTTSGM
jgi:hypothetical protein